VVDHLGDGDALALDHRGTAPLLARGIDPVALLRECLGREDGICAGRGGHMHLFSPAHLAASSGIVGASGPAGVGFALAAEHLRPGHIAVSFFGEGSMNQGMLLESLNLATAWKLPLISVCKDNRWAITTPSPSVTAGNMADRVKGFGLPFFEIDGVDIGAVWEAAKKAVERARNGGGPAFLLAHCVHREGHFLGYQPFRMTKHPVKEMAPLAVPIAKSLLRRQGASPTVRLGALGDLMKRIRAEAKEALSPANDPVARARRLLEADPTRLANLEATVRNQVLAAVRAALA
ncbi:MAG TPA: thiamine pyrophosphate-dependent dehydrogenase E1 component subunit alpha, partial [Candidatus Aminicenantes bacterium]|nr:thiamine pyrophosphate-dependent dehydrogenase E1 component subunit alpha [Candidatus Aminicenantes bacterium]